MSDSFVFPEISINDIRWAATLIGLRADAFEGNGSGHRCEVFRAADCIDVLACPGSGKTTLLVAKLAVLAEKWQDRTRGICVLSHTNVARNEVEARLGNTSSGRRLLSYPHYIGTIHGFVNDFLALPWLRSRGRPIKRIDTALCQERRWDRLKSATQTALERNRHDSSILRIKFADDDLGPIRWGKGTLGKNTFVYQNMQQVCRESMEEGYYCYEEMFAWAHDLLAKVQDSSRAIQERFPLLFIDESQDNSEDQSAILHRIFQGDAFSVIRQRFGDSNQAIFDSINGSDAVTDRFPNPAILRELPDSHRFSQRVADFAAPLGLDPQGLRGLGPSSRLASDPHGERHTLFLFDKGAEKQVLPAYAELLCEVFSEDELRVGSFVAVGQVHRPPVSEDPEKIPQFVGHFWPDYSHELSGREPKPSTLRDHVLLGIAKSRSTGKTHVGVDAIADGVVRLSSMMSATKRLPGGKRPHQQILRALAEDFAIRARYEYLMWRFIARGCAPTKTLWESAWSAAFREVAEAISGALANTEEARNFLGWSSLPAASPNAESLVRGENIFKYPTDGPSVHIRVGSVHSVKGETHTSILVLETFWYQHNLEALLPWLDGSRSGGSGAGKRDAARLKLHYVGITRPSHLLCLAMRKETFQTVDGDLSSQALERMSARGWNIHFVERLPD